MLQIVTVCLRRRDGLGIHCSDLDSLEIGPTLVVIVQRRGGGAMGTVSSLMEIDEVHTEQRVTMVAIQFVSLA